MTGGDDGPFDALQQQAIDAWQAGDMAGARKTFTLALKLAQDQGDKASEAICWHRLGSVALRQGELAGAAGKFEKALLLHRVLEDGAGYAGALHQLGTICLHRRDYEEARKLSRAAMNVQHQVGDTKGVARSLYQIAASFMEEDNVEEAAEGFRHAIKVMRGVEDHAGISLALLGAGYDVFAVDQDDAQLQRGFETIAGSLRRSVDQGRLSATRAEQQLSMMTTTTMSRDVPPK